MQQRAVMPKHNYPALTVNIFLLTSHINESKFHYLTTVFKYQPKKLYTSVRVQF